MRYDGPAHSDDYGNDAELERELLREREYQRARDRAQASAEEAMERFIQRRRQLRIALLTVGLAIAGSVGAAIATYQQMKGAPSIDSDVLKSLPTLPALIALGGVLASVSLLILLYLRPAERQRSTADVMRHTEAYVDFRLSSVGKRAPESTEPTEELKAEAVELLRRRLEEGALDQTLAAMRAEEAVAAKTRAVDAAFRQVRARLSREIAALAKRGNVNLVLGMATTTLGIFVLWWSVWTSSAESWAQFVGQFVPRLSLAFVIELFAYFFLRLYRQSLGEIKYFQNELTNIEARWIASVLAAESSTPATMSKVIRSLFSMERNFVLQKGQSTVELVREHQAMQADKAVLRAAERAARWSSSGGKGSEK